MNHSLSIFEADVLKYIQHSKYINQRIIAEETGYSIGTVNKTTKTLLQKGLLDSDMRVTGMAKQLFENSRPKNAVILAAGFGMRMVPINWTTPKALIELSGEKLIDRLIEQLHAAGVYNISVVVGFMKESFEYLIDKYDVELIVNHEYSTKNNLVSLNLVKEKLHNSYILPSDIWCAENPFSKYELYPWYMVSDAADNSSDVRVNRKRELVKKHENEPGNQMIGIAYLTEDLCKDVSCKIAKLAANPSFYNTFWETALYSGSRMKIPAKVVSSSKVVEINTYEQLREIDSASGYLKSDALETIAFTLGCEVSDIVNIEVLKKGMTNRSFLFTVNGKKYIMRIPGEGTDQLINRYHEAEVYKVIADHQLCDDPIYINPENGYKITKFIEGIRCCDPFDEYDIRCCMEKLRRFHSLELKVSHSFDLFENISLYEKLRNGIPSVYGDYEKTRSNVYSLKEYINAHKCKDQLTHIDAVPDNFLFDQMASGELSLQLTDWEYAGMQDKHVDIAMFAIYSQFDKKAVDHLIDVYFENDGGCDNTVRAKIYCYIAACGLLWSNWCEYKSSLGVEFGEYSIRQYRYAKEYYRYAKELINTEE